MLSDLDLINKVKTDSDSAALQELVNRHTGLYTDIINRYTYVPSIDRQDILEHKEYNIYQFALSYDPNRNMKFSVYVGQMLKYECLNLINHKVNTEEITENIAEEIDEKPDEETIKFIVDNTLEITDKRFFVIFKLRHLSLKKHSWKEIGKKVGMTYEGARKIYLHNIKFLQNRIKKENLIGK